MASGVFFVTFKSNHPTWYLIGIILFLVLGIALAAGGFATGNTGLGITGIVAGVAAIILLIEYLATK
jgi:hypothetical protein